jgi:serine/threonine protein kinase
VKITDFGLAKVQEHGSTTVTQLTGGTIYYMSPEQLAGLGNVDHRGDLYSLGMTLYEVLTGSVPFEKTESDFGIREKIVKGKIPPPKVRNATIPDALNSLVVKAIARDTGRRFQTAAEMRAALEKVEAGLVPRGKTERKPVRYPDPRFLKWGGVSVASLLLLAAGYYYIDSRPPSPAYAVVSVLSVPSDASVMLDGRAEGRTPLTLRRDVPGAIALKIDTRVGTRCCLSAPEIPCHSPSY